MQLMDPVILNTEKNVRDILQLAVGYSKPEKAVVVYDTQSVLSKILTEAYRYCLPEAVFIDFSETSAEIILATLHLLMPADLVVLIQSTSFRLGDFRIRVDLFGRGIKVIEHPHLAAMRESESGFYVDSLAYDPGYYRSVGAGLKNHIDHAASVVIEGEGERLDFFSSFESAKLNVGDYTGMKNTGGQFPIGEVFTEAKDLTCVNGTARVFAFGDTFFKVNQPPSPITLRVAEGRVTEVTHATPEFEKVLANIRADEGEIWVRELGFGLNRALTRERVVSDVGTYERMCGVHLSLGAKHSVFKKPQFTRKSAKHHVDVFIVADQVRIDETLVYEKGAWRMDESHGS